MSVPSLLLVLATAAAVKPPPVLLVDNGSRRAASVLALRQTARALGEALGGEREVLPVSLRFSDGIPASELDGAPARLLRQELCALAARGEACAVVTPLFLGPSASFTKGLAECRTELDAAGARLELLVGACLVEEGRPDDDRVARALASLVLEAGEARGLGALKVALVDHGTPSKAVNAVRGRLEAELRELLAGCASAVAASSMERREGAAFDFNEPLLEGLLATAPFDEGDVIVAMAFLQPGRHAGEGGDVEQIIEQACARSPTLRAHTTPLLASQPLVVDVLRDRVHEAEVARSPVDLQPSQRSQ